MKRLLILFLIPSICLAASNIAGDTIHFVGSASHQAGPVGDALPGGGCTSSTFSGDVSDYMGADGEPVIDMTAVAYTHATKNFNKTGVGVGVTAGTLAYITGTDITDGVYEVTTVTDDDNVICADITSADNTADATITIGGAYTDLQLAIDDDSTDPVDGSGKYWNRYICTNVDETISASLTPTSGANSRATGTFVKIIGYNSKLYLPNGDGVAQATSVDTTIISDMDVESYAGPYAIQFPTSYYGGAIEAIRSVESATRKRSNGDWISVDADDNAIDVLTVGGDNIEIRNIKFHNTDLTTDNSDCVTAASAREGTTFVNCWFDDTDDLIAGGDLDESVFLDCYFGKTIGNAQASYGGITSTLFQLCVFNGNGLGYAVAGLQNSTMINCLAYAGGSGIQVDTGTCRIIGCVVYNQTGQCFWGNDAARTPVVYNCIMSPAAISDFAFNTNATGSSIISFNNCAYSVTAGASLTIPFYNDNPDEEFFLPGTIEQDPQFVDAANFDFRLKEGSPCTNMGIGGFDPAGYSSIGLDASDRNKAKSGYRTRYEN